jgi:hypothetical protein
MILLTGAPKNGLAVLYRYLSQCGLITSCHCENVPLTVDPLVQAINNDILRISGCAWLDVPNGTPIKTDGSINYRIAHFINHNPNIDYLVDPRFVFTWQVWEHTISDVDLFVTFRHPGEAALSHQKEFGGFVGEALSVWQQYAVRLATMNGAFVEFGADVDFYDYDDNVGRAMSFLELDHFSPKLEKVFDEQAIHTTNKTSVFPAAKKLYQLLQTKKEN